MKVSCQNCEWEGDTSALVEVNDLYERVQPGDTMPDGQCPECGMLCFEAEEAELLEFRVTWQQHPMCDHWPRVLFVEAANENDAKAVATDYIERKFGVRFTIHTVQKAPKVPPGRVIGEA